MHSDSPIDICIDLRPLETSNKFRGFGYYISNLIDALLEVDKNNNYHFIAYSKENPAYKKYHARKNISFTIIDAPKVRQRLWWLVDQFALNKTVRKISPDVFVSLDTAIPLLLIWQSRIKLIATIHDLIPIVMAKEYQFPVDKTLEFRLKFFTAARADKILTISEYSKKDIVKYLKVDPKKITTTYEAVSDEFKPASDNIKREMRLKYARGNKYFMIIGDFYGIDPRKNYQLIVEAYTEYLKSQISNLKITSENVKSKDSSQITNHQSPITNLPILLFVGQSGGTHSEYSKIVDEAKKLGIDKNVVFTGFVSKEDLPRIYSAAEAMLYPSLYEGFGLPILQAMACGCPVVTTNATSIPEVAGKAAVIVDHDKPEDLAASMATITSKRNNLANAGFENTKQFSWEKCASQTLECIEKTIK